MANYNHLINITKAILGFTAINYVNYNYNVENQSTTQICSKMYTIFNMNNEIMPEYKPIVNVLYKSINNTLNCSFTDKTIHSPIKVSNKKKKSYLSYLSYETIILVLCGVIISKVASMNIYTKQKYI